LGIRRSLLRGHPVPLDGLSIVHRRAIPRDINDDERVLDSPFSGFRLFHEYDFTVH
jgi:hypothetical protein